MFAVHHQPCTEATKMSLKPLSLACAAATLIGIAGLMPARAQPPGLVQLVTNGPQAKCRDAVAQLVGAAERD